MMIKEQISLDILECNKCELAGRVINKVIGRGTSENPSVLFVGEAPGCISGDSLIDTAFRDKLIYPNGILIKDLIGKKDFFVYSYDKINEKLVLGKVKKVWKTGRKEVYEVFYTWWFNTPNGKILKENSLKVSINHPFLLKTPKAHNPFKGINQNGIDYLSIERGLKINHSLQPFYRREEHGYAHIGTSSDNVCRESRFLLEFKLGRKLEEKEQCHHKDENKLNDSWDNLELQTIGEYSSIHTKGKNNCMYNPLIKEKHKNALESVEYRENMSIVMKNVFKDPEKYAERLIQIQNNKHKISATLKEKYKNSSFYYAYLLSHQTHRGLTDEEIKIKFNEKFPCEQIPDTREDNHKIFSIEYLGVEDVYDMEVETHHNFAVNDIFVHNSEENKTGQPFVGRSGKVLDGMIEYMGIENYVIINRLKCFINPKVMIYTSEGYKFITNVQVGDLVLTHKGRFRKVLSRIHDLPKEERMNIEKLYRIKTHHKNYVLPSSHRFLFLSGKWIEVGKLKQGDKIKVLGEKCIICGKIYWKNPDRFDFADNTCSPYCHNISISKKPSFGKSISKAMFKSYQEGTRDKFEITKKANNATRKKVKNGTFHLLSKNTNLEHRKKQRLSASKSFQGFNEMKIKKGAIGLGEIELSEWLLSKKINFISQYSVENYNYDFFLPEHNLIIEVENLVAETQKVRIDRRNVKEKFIHIKTNHDIVYLHSDRIIEETERVLKNHDGKYYFCETEIIKIEEFHSDRNQYLYSLEIEEDESFIAGGIVHHNCRPPQNANPTPGQLKACHPFLLRQIEYYNPTLIILLGNYANKGFGPNLDWGEIQFYEDRYYCKLYHPAALLYQSKNKIPQAEYMDKIIKMMEG